MRDIWNKALVDIDEINHLAREDPRFLICRSEEYYRRQLEETAGHVERGLEHSRLILLTGPSASGKTTTARLLSERLGESGIKAHVISFDNFFIDRERVQILPSGRPDFESLAAMDLPTIHSCFTELLTTGFCRIPIYDFHTGKRRAGETIPLQLGPRDVVIAEGIHALNPDLLPQAVREDAYKVYACVQREYGLGEDPVVSSRQIRLLRRMLRDYYHRSAQPEYTMFLWENVCLGEEMYIKPFKQYADVIIDTLHDYELCVMEDCLRPVLSKTEPTEENQKMLAALQECLRLFHGFKKEDVPVQSLLQEFVG